VFGTLNRGSYFGVSESFKIQDLGYYGDIIAGTEKDHEFSPDIIVLQISRSYFDKIPFYEKETMMR
jgi:hypothetical protein